LSRASLTSCIRYVVRRVAECACNVQRTRPRRGAQYEDKLGMSTAQLESARLSALRDSPLHRILQVMCVHMFALCACSQGDAGTRVYARPSTAVRRLC
jgi:hypothetical protein